ncbi:D-alanyl-D-alanine carboxypeptidase [Phycicoccus sp. BSK3Z-2]|uniref:D-alanyl-D-alanine carboxypeptidase n=1 Tax=Phycicoccus avicenniae TaxID=2828860 RepID=A0A941D9W5_9MICO|nr:D-alanyl-D-alanine carboxypeptidase [Phycicoccus avicenniae]MBR7744176.1 D-alanyl-D-alanine carboxypeptidase [Phycicoccus avicenniae]
MTSADRRIADRLDARATTSRFGRYFSGTVLDAGTGEIVWAHRRTAQMLPASNAKLFTAATALDTLGPNTTFTTSVRRGKRANHVVLVGTGDALLNSAKLTTLARETKAWVDAKGYKKPQVYIDDSFFPAPSLAYGWKESYVIDSVTPVRPLVRDNRDIMDTSADAGRYLAARLRALGIPGARYAGRQDVATWRTTIASKQSFTVAGMVRRTILTSDNDVAEILLRRTSYEMGNGTAWSGAKTTQTAGAARHGTGFGVLYDGSGLSRADRLSTFQIAKLLRTVQNGDNPRLNTLRSRNVMPTAGRTGTLKNRFTSSAADCARGRVWAKTGTLGDTVALSGWTTGTDGRTKVFSFLVNRKDSSSTLKSNVDMLAATVNGCY